MAEPEGFREYVESARHTLVRTAYFLTGDHHAAEDLVQATLIRVWPHWERIVSRPGDVGGYVNRTMVNTFITTTRRRRWREVISAVPPPEPVTEAGTDTVVDRMALVHHLARLPARQRVAITLRYFLDLSEAETAQIMDCSVGTVKSATSRGIARLNTLLAAAMTEGERV